MRMAKERENNSKDIYPIYQSNVIKYEEDRVVVDDLKILERWGEYYQNLTNEEKEGMNSKHDKWSLTLQRSLVHILKWL